MTESHINLLSELRTLSKRTFSLWRSVRLFQTISVNGINPTEEIVKSRTTEVLETFDEITKTLVYSIDEGYRDNLTRDVLRSTANTAREVIQASTLAFGHAILDELASELCRLSSSHDPDAWFEHISNKKIELSHIREGSGESEISKVLNDYIKQLCRESLIKRINALHAKCPPAGDLWIQGKKFSFDSERLQGLDHRRQGVLHRLEFSLVDESQFIDDLSYLENVSTYLIDLLAKHHKIMLWRPDALFGYELQVSKGEQNYLNYEALLLASALAVPRKQDLKVTHHHGAIYVADDKGTFERLHIVSPLTDLVASDDKRLIAFVRFSPRTPQADLTVDVYSDSPAGISELWIADVDGKNQRHIFTEGEVSYMPDNEYSQIFGKVVRGIFGPQFSPNCSRIYFLARAWVTSAAVFYIDLADGAVHYLTSGNSIEVLRDGEFAGNLLISQHRYRPAPEYGSFDHRWMVTPDGTVLYDFDDPNRVDLSAENS